EAVRTNRHGTPMASDEAYRAALAAFAEKEGNEALHRKLLEVDPASYEAIHPHNVRRVIRALEIHKVTGKPKSLWDSEAQKENPRLSLLTVCLLYHRKEKLYERVDHGVDEMMRNGLLEEAARLYREGLLREGTTAAQAIGYKEMRGVLTGECSVEEGVARLKLATRHYAKRQLTWFLSKPHVPLYRDDEAGNIRPEKEVFDEALTLCYAFLQNAVK
ncbi:MAG: tRNA (adenosine(37)-N6)-dimethylallyltransferase MiaA, partial [Clostridia bacterium]|nr:tRNA (adenosine(37)-N6)-dimethylallyltransferase MiaA [Clostridia bacterium]